MSARQPGFAGLIAAGMTPQEAWQQIRDDLASDPGARAILADMANTPSGQIALRFAEMRWAEHGLRPPWEGLL